ncbi:hypothetical protein WH188_10570 [Sphingobacterium sp. MYb388]
MDHLISNSNSNSNSVDDAAVPKKISFPLGYSVKAYCIHKRWPRTNNPPATLFYSSKPGLSVSQPREQVRGKFIGQVISCLPFRGKLFPEKIRK